MGPTKVYRVVAEGELEVIRSGGVVALNREDWPPHRRESGVFVFIGEAAARGWAHDQLNDPLRLNTEPMYLLKLYVDPDDLLEDCSAEKLEVKGNHWLYSRLHRGPIPVKQPLEFEALENPRDGDEAPHR
jgi:hypothetical protein